jgi:hypothetical protein
VIDGVDAGDVDTSIVQVDDLAIGLPNLIRGSITNGYSAVGLGTDDQAVSVLSFHTRKYVVQAISAVNATGPR